MDSGALSDALPATTTTLPSSAVVGAGFAEVPTERKPRIDWRTGYRLALLGTDTAVIAAALLLAQRIRFDGPVLDAVRPVDTHTVVSILLGLLWLGALHTFRSRETRYLGQGATEYQRVSRATFSAFGLVAILLTLAKIDVARGYLVIALPLGLVGLLGARLGWRSWLIARRRSGASLLDAIVVGSHEDATRVAGQLMRRRHAGYRPAGIAFTDGSGGADVALVGETVIRTVPFESLVDTVAEQRAHAVVLAGSLPGGPERIQELGWALENICAELIIVSRLTHIGGPRMTLRPVEGVPMLHVDLLQRTGSNHVVKRIIDIALASVALVVLLPLMLAVMVAVRLDSPGPVFFKQERVGQSGSRFEMLKFRSMAVDAEARLAALRRSNEGAGLLFKMRDDPRVTRVGRILRRFSIDELPQLVNVLAGTMSLIGPRPPLPREVAAYGGRVSRRLLRSRESPACGR